MSDSVFSGRTCAKCGVPLYEYDNYCGVCGEKVPRCVNCGAILPGDAEFCIKCGASTVTKCSCGAALPDDALFCPKCGSRVSDNATAPASSQTPVNVPRFGSLFSRQAFQANVTAPQAPLPFEAQVGAYVEFGNYPQNNGDTPEPIEWLVLENDGKTALLISRYGLDCKQFHHKNTSISWRECDLRKWLNSDFLKCAFTAEERQHIAESKINTGKNPETGTPGCGETKDKVFCLSIEEVNKYLKTDEEKKCLPTAYAVSHEAHKDNDTGCCWYWLRSPGSNPSLAAHVRRRGNIFSNGFVDVIFNSVRPAMRVFV